MGLQDVLRAHAAMKAKPVALPEAQHDSDSKGTSFNHSATQQRWKEEAQAAPAKEQQTLVLYTQLTKAENKHQNSPQ